jgi:c-di-GMP phosphodiesterase
MGLSRCGPVRGDEKPQELVMLPLMRARFCEPLAPCTGLAQFSNDLFLLGLLSRTDAILGMKLAEAIEEVSIQAEIHDALLGKTNPFR